jgi:hypothetical protein
VDRKLNFEQNIGLSPTEKIGPERATLFGIKPFMATP